MALDHKQLIKTQLPNVAASLGAPANGKTWYLKQITLYNTGATNEVVKLYLQGASGNDQFIEYTLGAKETYNYPLEYPYVLEATEALFGVSTTGATVNIFVTGAEK